MGLLLRYRKTRANAEIRDERGVSFELGGFAESLAEVFRNALLDKIAEVPWKRSCDRNEDPEQCGKHESRDGDRFEGDRYGVGLIQVNLNLGDVRGQLDTTNDDGCKQKGDDRKRADADEQQVDGARDVLATAAMRAVREVLLIVSAHRR